MKCLIIAAGKGARLSHEGDSKPLIHLLGIPLIERVIRGAIEAGIDQFAVVSGYNGDRVRSFLDDLAPRCGVHVTHVINSQWERGNGLSVLMAKQHLDEPFVLLMTDHLFDPDILRDLMTQPPGKGEITLAVDHQRTSPFIDLDDVTRVSTQGRKLRDIGKGLVDYDGFDTGIFVCTPAIFGAIERSIATHQDSSLSGGVRVLAADDKVNVFDTGMRFWIDVDDPKGLAQARRALLTQLRDKPNDGPVSRYLNRPLSVRISRGLVQHDITPNQISVASFVICVVAAILFAVGGYPPLLLGAILTQFASIIDGCDGEVARLKFLTSDFGGWFDAVLDRYADAFLLLGLTWHTYAPGGSQGVVLIGLLAIIGSFMLSYTADKYDSLMRTRLASGRSVRIGRDIRLLLIALGAAVNLPFMTLLLVAVLMNGEVVRRVWMCRDPRTMPR